MGDIEIAQNAKLEKIFNIAKKAGIDEEFLALYGNYKSKVDLEILNRLKDKNNGKLILVTSINPTPLGEGKTTVSIGLVDGLNKIGKNAIGALREPSLGPVFGIKGGATGGGYSQVAPMEDINLHFTGDIHAMTAANNLISAVIDNHIYSGNELGFETVTWKRCMDLNDRQLRRVETGLSNEKNIVPRMDGFDITVASEIMAVLCLSENLQDLKKKISQIVVGYNKQNEPITVDDLKIAGAVTVLLKDAIKPNLVQTLENNPCLIHGGPFANIAHGCNSIIATRVALKLGDYVVTEAGFGADLGAEKFLDIKCRKANLKPDAVVCVATIKALKYHGGLPKEEIQKEDVNSLIRGTRNLLKHIENLRDRFGLNVVVAINKYTTDTNAEIQALEDILQKNGIELSLCENWEKGSNGITDLANKVVTLCEKKSNLDFTYDLTDSIETKINKVCKNIYGASDVEYSEKAKKNIKQIEALKYTKLPVCIAKTQYSLSDNPKNLECEEPFTMHIEDVILKAGAGFVVVLTGKIMTMPGLPKVPAAEKIDIDENGKIIGIF